MKKILAFLVVLTVMIGCIPITTHADSGTAVPFSDTANAAFSVATQTTQAAFAATDHGLYITELTPYITEPQEVALVDRISNRDVTWVFDGYASTPITNGTEHTVTFLSADNRYRLNAVITQRDGAGPIEFNQYVTGLTEGLSIAYSDMIGADISLSVDGETTLYRFSRSRINDGSELFAKGVLTDTLSAGTSVLSSVENHYLPINSILPYQVLDIDGSHGVYFGHYWSFGKILVSMNESQSVSITTYLSDNANKTVTRDVNETLSIPGFFIGTYEGNVDRGSNQMKNWFWDHKMTHTLRENTSEPYIEIGVISDRVSGIDTLFDIWPDLAEYVNVLKLDYGWTIPDGTAPREDIPTERLWIPNDAQNKYGQSDGSINMGIYDAIGRNLTTDDSDNRVFLSLYMADTFEGVDIGTNEGREKQLQALKVRMRPSDNDWGVGYDYWRSDYDVEQRYDYDDHEGLLYILDEMIAYSEDFRYEHCMGAGSLKDFTTLERMTFMTTEDTSLPLHHRMSLYANTYMINPLQLKADISMRLTSRDYGDVIGGDILENGQPGYTDETYVKYALRTGMLGAMMITFNEAGYRYGNNLEIIKEHYDLYNKTHREILRNTDVYHILPAPTGWTYADWDGIEYYNPNINKGVVQLFKENKTAPNSKTIVLDGLDENTLYTLTFTDRTEQNTIMSGAKLMSDGITVTGMDTQYASELIYIEPFVTDSKNPTIISAVAINNTQFKITTSEPINVKNAGAFALFLAKDGVVDNLNERSNINFAQTGTRYGGTIAPANELTTQFVWTINPNVNATNSIHAAIANGYEVYFGLNGAATDNMIDVTRAADNENNGFIPNLISNHATHEIYGVKVNAYTPNTITSAKLVSDTQVEISFANPITACTDALFLCLLDSNGTVQNGDGNSSLDDHTPMDCTVTGGKLVCTLRNDHPGLSEDGKNIKKFIVQAGNAYPNYTAGIVFLESNNTLINGSNLLENTTDANAIPLKATGQWGGTSRDICTTPLSAGVAKIGHTLYFSVEEALHAATDGDEIGLLDDVTVADPLFVLPAGVTLDLNGHTLTVADLMAFGHITDSTQGRGKVSPTTHSRIVLHPNNPALPLFDTDGYRFFPYTLTAAGPKTQTQDAVSFGVQLTFDNPEAYALLAGDEAVAVKMAFAVTHSEKLTNFTFTFNRATLSAYEAAWRNRTDLTKTPTLVVTVGGIDGIDSISCTPILTHTATTVGQSGATLTHSH